MNPDKQRLNDTLATLDGAYAPATLRAYREDVEALIDFCIKLNAKAFPVSPETLAAFIAEKTTSGLKSASIRRAVAAIATLHRLNRFEDPSKDPIVTIAMRKMHRALGREAKQAQGISIADLNRMLKVTEDTLKGQRDRALLLFAYDSLLRRSEMVAIEVSDLRWASSKNGPVLQIHLRRSKTDPEGVGRWLSVSEGTQTAISAWLKASGITQGPLFRGIQGNKITASLGASQINRLYKRLAQKAGLQERMPQAISGHSFRVGAAQDLLRDGATLPMIMHRGRWTKPDTVMRYLEHAASFDPAE